MFSLTRTFQSKEGFRITPILWDNKYIFIPQEIEEPFGFANLADSIRNSEGLIEEVDYFILSNGNLRNFKELLRSRSDIPRPLYERILFAPTLIVLTESGFYALAFRSHKTECIILRVWVTNEVLPALRRIGKYELTTERFQGEVVAKEFESFKQLATSCGITDKNQILLAAQRAMKQIHGVEPLKLLGVQLENEAQEMDYTPTDLAPFCGVKTAQETNKLLERHNLQTSYKTKSGKLVWEPTAKAKEEKLCHLIDTGKKHSDGASIIQVKWYKRTAEYIRNNPI